MKTCMFGHGMPCMHPRPAERKWGGGFVLQVVCDTVLNMQTSQHCRKHNKKMGRDEDDLCPSLRGTGVLHEQDLRRRNPPPLTANPMEERQ
jgi:hypothetical protein